MKAFVAVSRNGARSPIVEEVELGSLQENEVLVRVVACGICRTDVDTHAGRIRTPKPMVLGHEGSGVVEKVGSRVTTLEPGDHVILCASGCGECTNCKRDLPTYCDMAMRRNFGGLRADGATYLSSRGGRVFGNFFGQSSFAQYAIAEAQTAVKVPVDLPLQILAPIGCSVATGAGAVFNAFAPDPDQTMAVLGLGAVGLSAVMAARIFGLRRIVAIDQVPSRVQLARDLGATDALEAQGSDVAERLRGILPGGVDFCFNTTNDADVMTASIACLAMHGVAAFVSVPHETWIAPMQTLLDGGRALKALLGCDASPRTFIPRLIDFYRSGQLPLDRLITYYPFANIAEAFRDFDDAAVIKPVLLME